MGKVWWIDLLQAAKGLRMSMLFFLLADLSIALALGAKPDACLMHKTSYSGSIWAKARALLLRSSPGFSFSPLRVWAASVNTPGLWRWVWKPCLGSGGLVAKAQDRVLAGHLLGQF